MRLSLKQKKLVQGLYIRDGPNRQKSFRAFHKEYQKVLETDFVSYWLLNRYVCNNCADNISTNTRRETETRNIKRRYRFCLDPDLIR